MEEGHFLVDDLRGHVIGFPAEAHGVDSEQRFLDFLPPVLAVLDLLDDPGVDQSQEAGEGEGERVDAVPRTRPVDFVPVLVGDFDEAEDG